MTIGMICAWLVMACSLLLAIMGIMGIVKMDRVIRHSHKPTQRKPQPGKAAVVEVTVKPVPADLAPMQAEPRMITNIKYGALND